MVRLEGETIPIGNNLQKEVEMVSIAPALENVPNSSLISNMIDVKTSPQVAGRVAVVEVSENFWDRERVHFPEWDSFVRLRPASSFMGCAILVRQCDRFYQRHFGREGDLKVDTVTIVMSLCVIALIIALAVVACRISMG